MKTAVKTLDLLNEDQYRVIWCETRPDNYPSGMILVMNNPGNNGLCYFSWWDQDEEGDNLYGVRHLSDDDYVTISEMRDYWDFSVHLVSPLRGDRSLNNYYERFPIECHDKFRIRPVIALFKL